MMGDLFMLAVGHAVADAALQSPFMSEHKRRGSGPNWIGWLSAHGLVNGGAVYLVTGSVWAGIAETVLHMGIDFFRCEGKLNTLQDQGLHAICKVVWWALCCI